MIDLAPTQLADTVRRNAAAETDRAQITKLVKDMESFRQLLSNGTGRIRYVKAVLALSGAAVAVPAPPVDNLAAGMGNLFVGTAILAMAAFSPFLLLKLIPMAEAALVAQGVSRSPVRGAQSAMSNVYHAQSMSRLAGGNNKPSHGTAQRSPAPWAVGAFSTGASKAEGSGTGTLAGTAVAAGAGPAAAAARAGATVVQAGAKTAGKTVQNTTDTAGGKQSQPTRQPEAGSRGDRR